MQTKRVRHQTRRIQRSTYIFEISIINKLHQDQDVDEKLGLGVLDDFFSPYIGAVEHVFDIFAFLEGSRGGGQLKTLVKVRQVVSQHEGRVAEGVQFAQLFELFG